MWQLTSFSGFLIFEFFLNSKFARFPKYINLRFCSFKLHFFEDFIFVNSNFPNSFSTFQWIFQNTMKTMSYYTRVTYTFNTVWSRGVLIHNLSVIANNFTKYVFFPCTNMVQFKIPHSNIIVPLICLNFQCWIEQFCISDQTVSMCRASLGF